MQKNGFISWALIVLATVFLLEGAARAGTIIDQDMIDIWGKKSGLVLSYSKKRLRIDQKDGKLSTIIHFRNNRILILDHLSKTYITYPFSKWEKEVSQRIKGQKATERREIRVEPTGEERTINNFGTRQIHVFIDGVLFQNIWLTRDVDLEGMLKAMENGLGRLSGLPKAEMEEREEIYTKVKEWGFPILIIEYREAFGKTLEEVTEVNRIESRNLDGELFTPPKSYVLRSQ